MSARLLGRTGKTSGMEVALSDEAGLGAAADVEIRVPFEGVSRAHAHLRREGDRYWIEDRGSTNGTFVNGERIERLRLRHLDVITLGRDVDFIFVERAGTVATVIEQAVTAAHLEWIDGPEAGSTEAIPKGETTVGRDWSCTLNVDHPAVSKIHARFQRSSDHVTIQDLESTNGTLVNGRRIEGPKVLEDGDVVSLGGKVSLRVRIQLDPRAASAAEPVVDSGVQQQAFDQEWRTRLIWSPEEMAQIEVVRAATRASAEDDDRKKPPKRRPAERSAGGEPPSEADGLATQMGKVPSKAPAAPDRVLAAARRAAEGQEDEADRTQYAGLRRGDADVPDAVAAAAAAARPAQEAAEDRQPDGEGHAAGEPQGVARQVAGAAAAGAETVPKLTVKLIGDGRVLYLRPGETIVGRAEDADLRLRYPVISRGHARIVISEEGVVVEDLRSSNGTTVNRARITAPTPVVDGDRVGFARFEFEIRISGPGARPGD